MMKPTDKDGNEDPLEPFCMVTVKNAWKTYNGKEFVLKDLNMTIVKGKIYSLLGSSGVGKTTLLQSITGITCLDSGDIHVDIESRLQIGYMPQELALYAELTLKETFQFFGMILYMSKKEIENRVKQLSHLLDLPPVETQICNLSGGQQRRISLTVAMLNNPTFLILDEPTVSLDSVLKESIWEYLIYLTKEEGKTVLLTTHYIEEANNSDKVGFMSEGIILLEGSPEQVKYCSNPPLKKLEDVYFHLYDKQQKSTPTTEKPEVKDSSVKSLSELSNYSSWRVMAFGLKTFYYIRRNLLIFYVFIFSPVMMSTIMTWALQSPRGLKLGYVNQENNCTNQYFNCSTPLSCRYLKQLEKNQYQMVEFNSVDVGKEAVESNHIWGLVRFNWNFSEGVINRLDYFYAEEHVQISDDDEARVWLDMSSFPIGYMMKKHLYDSFMDSIEDWYNDCGWNAKAAHPILRIEDPIVGEFEGSNSLISSGIPTVIIVLMFSVSICLGLIFVLTEKELGTLKRCRVNGLKTYELLVSILVSCFICLVPTGISLLLLLYLHTGPANGPIFWTTLLLYLQCVTGILLGMVIGLLASKLSDAIQTTTGFLYALTFMAGILWPTQGSHWMISYIHKILPSAIPFLSFTIIANRGFDYIAYVGLAHSIAWITILIIIIIIIVRIVDKR